MASRSRSTTPTPTTPRTSLIDVKTVAQMLCCSVSQVWRMTKHRAGFPQPLKTGPMSTRWNEAEVEAWITKVTAQYLAGHRW